MDLATLTHSMYVAVGAPVAGSAPPASLSSTVEQLPGRVSVTVLAVCPKAPPGAQVPTDTITGYVLWGVGILFVVGIIIAIGAIIAGRVFAMPHASKVGVISVVVVFLAAIGYLVLPSMLSGLLGNGCI